MSRQFNPFYREHFDQLSYGDERPQPDDLTPEQARVSEEAARKLGEYLTAMAEYDRGQTATPNN